MRRFLPLLIIVLGLFALYVDFFPGAKMVLLTSPDGGMKTVETKLGLDLQGGLQLIYQAQPVNGKTPSAGDMNIIRSIMEKRVNSTGAKEPIVETQGDDRVVVQVPGATNPEEIRNLVGQAGLLQFVPLPRSVYGYMSNPGTASQSPVAGSKPVPSAKDPLGSLIADGSLKPLFAGDQIASATVGKDQSNQWAVEFTLKDQASQAFGDYTTKNVGDYFAIVLDGNVVSAPFISSSITGGKGQISGNFTSQSAGDLVTILNYGALPFPVQEVASGTVNATLGSGFLNQTLLAGAIGIGLVALFMLIHYRLPGIVACLALLYYAALVFGVFRVFPVTLTLAGIAGFVLSVGMAVDANILIFERTKEELRVGKTLTAAIEAGFNRAWNSILDSNVSSLITATILYLGGAPTVKGFALVLIIGILASMFTAVTVSRTLLRFVVGFPAVRKAWLFGVTDAEFQARSPLGRAPRGEARARV